MRKTDFSNLTVQEALNVKLESNRNIVGLYTMLNKLALTDKESTIKLVNVEFDNTPEGRMIVNLIRDASRIFYEGERFVLPEYPAPTLALVYSAIAQGFICIIDDEYNNESFTLRGITNIDRCNPDPITSGHFGALEMPGAYTSPIGSHNVTAYRVILDMYARAMRDNLTYAATVSFDNTTAGRAYVENVLDAVRIYGSRVHFELPTFPASEFKLVHSAIAQGLVIVTGFINAQGEFETDESKITGFQFYTSGLLGDLERHVEYDENRAAYV